MPSPMNVDQVYIANPATTNQADDLMYFGRSPYGISDDFAIKYSDFAAQFGAPYTPSALTRTDDTNVTLTLGGSPTTALLHAASLTLGWAGQLAVGRGGTGNSTFTAFSVLCAGTTSTNPFQNVSGVGTAGQVLTSNGAGLLPTWETSSGSGVTAAQVQNQTFTYGVDTGSADVYTITISPAPAAYQSGQIFLFTAANDNTTASTFGVNALGSAQLYVNRTGVTSNPLQGGEILAGQVYMVLVVNDGAQFILLNPSTSVTAYELQNQFYTYGYDGGSANAYDVTLNVAVTSYNDGALYTFLPAHNNTTASTINFGAGVKALVLNGNIALSGGEIVTNSQYFVMYNQTYGKFVLLNPTVAAGITSAQIQQQSFTYAVDSGAANAYVVTLSPAPSSYTDGLFLSFKASNANSGASTINVNSIGVANIVTNAGAALSSGAILANGEYILMYNSTVSAFVLVNSSLGATVTGQALTRTNDTNVTVTLGGSPSTALVNAASMTLGWTGTLAVSRGGSGRGTATAFGVICGGTTTTSAHQSIASVGTSGQVLTSNGAGALPTMQAPAVTQANIQQQAFTYAADTGAANAYVVTLSPAPASYTDGMYVAFVAGHTNTTASTINVNSLGVKNIVSNAGGGVPLSGGEIQANGSYILQYNIGVPGFVLINSSQPTSIQSVVPSGSAVSTTNNTAFDVTFIDVPAGKWLICGNVSYISATDNIDDAFAWVSTTSATQPDASLSAEENNGTLAPTGDCGLTAPSIPFTFASTTRVYLSGLVAFGSGSVTACGGIYAIPIGN